MAELKKIISSDSLFFNRILIRPNIKDVLVKSLTGIDSDGNYTPLLSSPIFLSEDILVKNNGRNSIAAEIVIEHPFIKETDTISKYVHIDINRTSLERYAELNTNTVSLINKGSVHIVHKAENASSVVISAKVGIRGYSYDDRLIMDTSVGLGIGETREMLSVEDKVDFAPSTIFKYKNGSTSKDIVDVKDGVIQDYDKSCMYVYKPDYLSKGFRKDQDVSVSDSNAILIKNKDVYRIECRVSARILDLNESQPVIKYIGVVSR